MPCYDPSSSASYEREQQRQALEAAFDRLWGCAVRGDAHRCALMRKTKETDLESFENKLYNGRDSDARKVAEWWDDHTRQDAERRVRNIASLQRLTFVDNEPVVVVLHNSRLFVERNLGIEIHPGVSSHYGIFEVLMHREELTEYTLPDVLNLVSEALPEREIVILTVFGLGVSTVQIGTGESRPIPQEELVAVNNSLKFREWINSLLTSKE